MTHLYSNEIVFRGHPDKVCDQISDAVLDAYLSQDKKARVAVEAMGGKGCLFLTGEITSTASVDVERVARRVLRDVGYDPSIDIVNNIGSQSPDIAQGTSGRAKGAGDQGMMFGFATTETSQMLPKAQVILQRFAMRYDELRKNATSGLCSDGKAQITGEYWGIGHGRRLKRIKTALISYQNDEQNRKRNDAMLRREFELIASDFDVVVEEFIFNPTGRFSKGGFDADAGLTGRKIVVDNYHSFANVGGGAFSGKDPTKVDRSGAYMARKIACEILQDNPELGWIEVQLAYSIGLRTPLSIFIDSAWGTIEPAKRLYERCEPHSIISELNLLNIKYEPLAMYGHFM